MPSSPALLIHLGIACVALTFSASCSNQDAAEPEATSVREAPKPAPSSELLEPKPVPRHFVADSAPTSSAPASSDPVNAPGVVTGTAAPGEYHLDEDPLPGRARRRVRREVASRPVEIILRSSPTGATAAVDGQPVGKTPSFWVGVADGRPHEFTFSLPGYAVARYRFVATHGGIVHGSLRRLAKKTDPKETP